MSWIWLTQQVDGEDPVIRVPERALAVWLPRGWTPCDPPARPERVTAPEAVPVPEPVEAPAPAKTTTKKAPASGPEVKSEGTV